MLERKIRRRLRGHRGYRAIQAINGIGPTMAAILVAEIGDVTRFRSAAALCSWAGSHPQASRVRHHRAARAAHQARIAARALGGRSKAPSATTAAANSPPTSAQIAERRGKNKATVAIARKVLTLVYYGLRDGEIRCLATDAA